MPKLYETITAENWEHGAGHNHRGNRMCLHNRALLLYWATGAKDEFARIHEAIALLFPSRPHQSIAAFNDHPDTTVEDVIRVCKVADV